MKKAGQKILLLVLPLFFAFVFFKSCTPEMVVSRLANREEKKEEAAITALIPDENGKLKESSPDTTETAAANIPAFHMVLEKGNYWTRGIPGFGENALSAFAGEYRIPGKTETVKVWMTMEFIYYEGWTNRTSLTNIQVQEKMILEGLMISSALNNNWTIVINVPLGMGLGTEGENRIILSLIKRLMNFSGQIQNISYPAIITY
jgi:hypothetical protein